MKDKSDIRSPTFLKTKVSRRESGQYSEAYFLSGERALTTRHFYGFSNPAPGPVYRSWQLFQDNCQQQTYSAIPTESHVPSSLFTLFLAESA